MGLHTLLVRSVPETTLPIERIAEQLGYQDTSNFSGTFRRWFQTTPLAMRKASRV